MHMLDCCVVKINTIQTPTEKKKTKLWMKRAGHRFIAEGHFDRSAAIVQSCNIEIASEAIDTQKRYEACCALVSHDYQHMCSIILLMRHEMLHRSVFLGIIAKDIPTALLFLQPRLAEFGDEKYFLERSFLQDTSCRVNTKVSFIGHLPLYFLRIINLLSLITDHSSLYVWLVRCNLNHMLMRKQLLLNCSNFCATRVMRVELEVVEITLSLELSLSL